MRIIEIQEGTTLLIRQLMELWEKSVRETHLFLPDGVLPDEVPVPVMDQTEENEVISIAKNHLQKTAEKLSRLTDATIIQAVEDEFEISEAVINYAEKHHIDMIVVGKHNHGFLSTVFLGSVASSVMRKSPVPVLVVPVTKEEQ